MDSFYLFKYSFKINKASFLYESFKYSAYSFSHNITLLYAYIISTISSFIIPFSVISKHFAI